MSAPVETPSVGDRVRIDRDEVRYPSRGTWPRFRGKTGTVVEINTDRDHPHLTEYGVVFGKVTPRSDGRGAFSWSGNESQTWFKVYELTPMSRRASQRTVSATETTPPTADTTKDLAHV